MRAKTVLSCPPGLSFGRQGVNSTTDMPRRSRLSSPCAAQDWHADRNAAGRPHFATRQDVRLICHLVDVSALDDAGQYPFMPVDGYCPGSGPGHRLFDFICGFSRPALTILFGPGKAEYRQISLGLFGRGRIGPYRKGRKFKKCLPFFHGRQGRFTRGGTVLTQKKRDQRGCIFRR